MNAFTSFTNFSKIIIYWKNDNKRNQYKNISGEIATQQIKFTVT